ncbi:MAG: hypothetical protein HRU19_10945 [Pseudobacteriovorax sp.]|nr:hypothetical protein [Pseudobacteriovorax sp.]
MAWITPLILTFFPEITNVRVPSSLGVRPIQVLVDDSQSMKASGWLAETDAIVLAMQKECVRLGCSLDISRMSEENETVNNGFSPLHEIVPLWRYEIGNDPWVIFTDGGSSTPYQNWPNELQDIASSRSKPNSLVYAFHKKDGQNLWLSTDQNGLFSFENKNMDLSVTVHRQINGASLPVQLQIKIGDKHISSTNVIFRPDDTAIDVTIPLAPLPRGNHYLGVQALPVADESIIWDNEVAVNLEVLPNTIGVLHLLGAPSWDGRFIRRYLKSEPKYDLISFFILRDPVDLQVTNERELSLIPFPVDRLFTEELPNFRSLILQNFSLRQFLEPPYQKNLVEFVKNGGGLLFIGGPRALRSSDFRNSPLAEILPFSVANTRPQQPTRQSLLRGLGGRFIDRSGPYYDSESSFTIEMANPDVTARDLANVYDDWLDLESSITKAEGLKGIHRMENVVFKEGQYTPLLNARLDSGQSIPLAVASYPDKGRALWIFSDSLWRLAMDPNVSRKVYYDFISSAKTWLLRQEFRQPLALQEFHLSVISESLEFSVLATGAAATYLDRSPNWKMNVCGRDLPWDDLERVKIADSVWKISGNLGDSLATGTLCSASISGTHPSFGSVESNISGRIPEILDDSEALFSWQTSQALAQVTGSQFLDQDSGDSSAINLWLESVTSSSGVADPMDRKTLIDYYWAFQHWWIFLFFLALPLEVLIRRWPQLSAQRV